jgi:hypothetical protein
MPVVVLPYHPDDHLPELAAGLPPDAAVTTVSDALPGGDVWPRLAALSEPLADLTA